MTNLNGFLPGEFLIDHINCGTNGSAVRVTHVPSNRSAPVAYFAPDAQAADIRVTRDRLLQELTHELRAAGVVPQPEPQMGYGIKKTGKQRWSSSEKHEMNSDSH